MKQLYTDKYLKAHGLFQNQSFEEFCIKIPKFYFKKEVPYDVMENFGVVEKLMAFSYFEYKLIDEAFAKAIHTLEMAMSIRYNELALPPQKRNPMFDFLIKSLTNEDCFDTDIQVLLNIKQLRNHFSHPERHSFGGAIYWNRIEFIARLINELYEDISLRIERKKLQSEFILNLQKSNLNYFLLMERGQNAPVILFNMNLLWINNKITPHTYLIQYAPLFDLTYETENQITNPEIFGLQVKGPQFTSSKLSMTDAQSNETINFGPIPQGSTYMQSLQLWKKEFDNISWNFMYEHGIQSSSSGLLVPELHRFQKM